MKKVLALIILAAIGVAVASALLVGDDSLRETNGFHHALPRPEAETNGEREDAQGVSSTSPVASHRQAAEAVPSDVSTPDSETTSVDRSKETFYSNLELFPGFTAASLGTRTISYAEFTQTSQVFRHEERRLAEDILATMGAEGLTFVGLEEAWALRDQGVLTLPSPWTRADGTKRFLCPESFLPRLEELRQVQRDAHANSTYVEEASADLEALTAEEFPGIAFRVIVSRGGFQHESVDSSGERLMATVVQAPGE